jgi:phosphoribosyl 1,2-cyclic phosphodiesterase
MLVSHLHHDHTMGWPFFKPVYQSGTRLYVYGPGGAGREFRELFETTFEHPFFPVSPAAMPSSRTFGTIDHDDVLAWSDPDQPPARLAPGDAPPAGALVVRIFRNRNHPNGGVLNYRIERGGRSVVMATDVEGSEGEAGDLADFARGTDLLIHDAQYTEDEYPRLTKGWGHSTWRMAAAVAARAEARRLVLYHHDPAHDDTQVEEMERLAREAFASSIAACEGLEIHL